jgi:hypothetical protein
MLQTLNQLVRDREGVVTEYTLFMLKMMQISDSIEEAISMIVRRTDFVGKIIREKMADDTAFEFGHRLIRNYNLGTNTSSLCLTILTIEKILSLEPKSESNFIVDFLLMNLFPQILTNPELRKNY